MELSERKQAILAAILKEHIQTAKAVGSSMITGQYGIDLSPASIRNEMVELEELGYLAQPHTSAGRVPTIKAYQYYLDHLIADANVSKREKDALTKAFEASRSTEERLKALAKAMAELCSTTVIVGFAPTNVYYTGLSNLFQQPEFSELARILTVSEVVDHLDEVMAEIYHHVQGEPKILLGRDNPFGEQTGVLLAKCGPDRTGQLIGILGPLRMPYQQHLAILRFTRSLLTV